VPQMGSWDCRYVVPRRKSVLGWGGMRGIADKDGGITRLGRVGGELIRVRPGDGAGAAGGMEGPG